MNESTFNNEPPAFDPANNGAFVQPGTNPEPMPEFNAAGALSNLQFGEVQPITAPPAFGQPLDQVFTQPSFGQQPIGQPFAQPVMEQQAGQAFASNDVVQPAPEMAFAQPPFEQAPYVPVSEFVPIPFDSAPEQPAAEPEAPSTWELAEQPVWELGSQPAAQPEMPAAPEAVMDAPVAEPAMHSFFTASHVVDDTMIEEDDDVDVEEDEIEDTSSYAFMQNRELSWLTFDERVLDQGADESVPLLERLNFISIFWSNLQEFFMVRVGSLTDLSFIDPPVRDSKTGMTPSEQIKAIHERCRELYPIQESYYEHVRGSLAKEGVRHLRPDDLSDEQRNYLSGYVTFNVEPFLSPQIINPLHPFPHLENGKLYILLRLDDGSDADQRKKDKKDKKDKKKKKGKGGAEGVVLGLIPLPHQCDRIIKLPGRGFQFILLEHAIEMFAPEIFSMYTIKHTNVICVTRNADIDANQTGDEQDEDYREHMRRLLKKRARLAPVRLECERPLSPVMEKLMLKRLGLRRSQVYDTIVPLDLSFTWGLGSLLSDSKRAKLSNPPFTPAWPVAFDRKRRIMDQVNDREVLLSYPYESMDPFVQLLKEAAFDPSVISIKITLYRLASQSQLAEALITAAENGKSVTALFELRARFDESNNIEWSQRFEQAGCNVIYGFRDYKVHSKICCITRQLPDGSIQHITQLGTGNYNEKTAKLYTDLSFITTDEAFGRDAVEFFRNMQLENVSDEYEVLCVAPLQIKPMILENLDRQIELARAGKPCGAFMKANSITDKDVIEKIAEASQAGVGITLFIRGICCLVPEVKGLTDNVRVVSIVGRLLEHSRIYCFGTPDDCVMYLSSADLMTRNLNKRVEIAWPILSEEIRWRILDYIDICLHDTAKLRELRPNATYTPLGAFCDLDEEGNSQPAFDAQSALISRAAVAAARAEAEAAERYETIAQLPFTMDQPMAVYDIAPAQTGAVQVGAQPVVVGDDAGQAPGFVAEPTFEPTPMPEPAPEPAPEPMPEPAPTPGPEPVPMSAFPPPPEIVLASGFAPTSQPAPEPMPASEPAPTPEPEPTAAPESEPARPKHAALDFDNLLNAEIIPAQPQAAPIRVPEQVSAPAPEPDAPQPPQETAPEAAPEPIAESPQIAQQPEAGGPAISAAFGGASSMPQTGFPPSPAGFDPVLQNPSDYISRISVPVEQIVSPGKPAEQAVPVEAQEQFAQPSQPSQPPSAEEAVPAGEPVVLTEMSIDEILAPLGDLPDSAVPMMSFDGGQQPIEQAVGTFGQQAMQQDIGAGQPLQPGVSTQPAAEASPVQPSPVPTTDRPSQPMQQQQKPGAFLDEESRTIEMPPEKRGLFSRFRS